MHESDTYLMILDEGAEKALKKTILRLGDAQVGAPDKSVKARLNAITDLERLKRMLRKTPKTASWQEILDTP